jgi:hypothetical protein
VLRGHTLGSGVVPPTGAQSACHQGKGRYLTKAGYLEPFKSLVWTVSPKEQVVLGTEASGQCQPSPLPIPLEKQFSLPAVSSASHHGWGPWMLHRPRL